jgi:hypothetical protein
VQVKTSWRKGRLAETDVQREMAPEEATSLLRSTFSRRAVGAVEHRSGSVAEEQEHACAAASGIDDQIDIELRFNFRGLRAFDLPGRVCCQVVPLGS